MFGLLKDVADLVGETIGSIAGIAIAPIAAALHVSESAVIRAIKAGCRTQGEIKRWLIEND